MGIPAKSGVSGAIMVVVPKVCGFMLWSPPLDALGNSVRGLHFCEVSEMLTSRQVTEYKHEKGAALLKCE